MNGNHLVCQMVDFFLISPQLGVLVFLAVQSFVQFNTLAGRCRRNAVLHVRNGGAVAALLLMHIVGADTGNGIQLIAVHINERLETILFAAVEQSVNRAFLVNLAMVGIEVTEEIIADALSADLFHQGHRR